jgi:hypothetical protein
MHEIMVGIDFSFIPEIRRPEPWKQFLIALSAVYPLTLVIPIAIHRVSDVAPFARNRWIQGALRATTLVAVLVFIITPFYTRPVRNGVIKTPGLISLSLTSHGWFKSLARLSTCRKI